MTLGFFEDLWDGFKETLEKFKDFIQSNYNNPLLWIGLFVVGLLVFFMVRSALSKGD